MIVGHNIKYDLEFLCGPGNMYRHDWIEAINNPDTYVWCTMQAEFRLLGQSKVQPSLDWCCERRGWEVKPGRLKEYWKAGISTEDIPDEEVDPYLKHDITVTGDLFRDQVAKAVALGMMPLLRMEMDAILATTCMEVNGMFFDKQTARTHLVDVLQPKYDGMLKELTDIIAKAIDVPSAVVNPLSNPFLTSFFYGGGWKWQQHELAYNDDGTPVLFKSGKRKCEHKTKVQRYTPELPRRVKITDKEREKTYTSVDEEMLNKLIKTNKVSDLDKDIIERILELRELKKLSSTYFDGYSKLVWYDGMIRTSLNHAIAATARLTSSAPNLQNAAHNEVRSHFKSRYDGGHLLEVDLSQIEVVIQAFKSQDPNMMRDVINGIDFHCKRGALTEHMSYEEFFELAKVEEVPKYVKIRKGAKQFSFQRAYGAGVHTISEKTGLTRGEVKAFILAEETEYPEIVTMQEDWIARVKASTNERDGEVCGELIDNTGARYRFSREKYKGEWEYKPTTIKNYPIQGQAGEVLKLILNMVRKFLWKYNKDHDTWPGFEPVLMVNTVHDSVIFDLPSWVNIPELAGLLIKLFESARQEMSNRFKIDFNLPISADAEYGVDWFSMKTVTGD
jgi:DNA polymerase I-like protein with 3'-5' exonuclease and polymerase domains